MGELAGLLAQIEQARSQLGQLQRDVTAAESQLSSRQAAQLVEVNAKLLVATLRAQTEAQAATRELEGLSRLDKHDVLTGLPSRAQLLDRLAHAIASAKRHGHRLALLFLGLDNFKHVIDTLGLTVGDEVFRLASHAIASSVREGDTVSRHGGDEFLILLDEVSEASDAALVAGKLIAALGAPHHAGGQSVRLAASIGLSLYPDDGEDADTLIARAEAAMRRAKREGLDSVVFHGQAFLCERTLEVHGIELPQETPPRSRSALAENERRHVQIREANEQLILAALDAQELGAATEQAHQQQTAFLGVLAHELRNPLTPIRNAAGLLGHVPTGELPRLQAIIERQVEHMSRLISDVLDLSRVSTGKLRLERQRVDMTHVIDEAIGACRPAMDIRLQQFSVEVPARGIEIDGDPVRLVQVVSNLLDNASKYTPDHGEIGLSVAVSDDGIVLTVSDTGIGITAGSLAKVFEPFVQDVHATDFNGFGLGIGLTVVRELVEAHGGTVMAHSGGSNLGSQFVVTLPRLHKTLERPGLAEPARQPR